MTNKEIAERLRGMVPTVGVTSSGVDDNQVYKHGMVPPDKVLLFADELDPPRPEPGTVVWWRDAEGLGDPVLGQFNDLGRIELFGITQMVNPDSVEYWPARILSPGEVVVKVPPVGNWPETCDVVTLRWHYEDYDGDPVCMSNKAGADITRSEAEHMEADR